MNLNDYFDPVNDILNNKHERLSIGKIIKDHSKNINIEKADIALFGLSEQANHIRHHLYKLFTPDRKIKLIDLGNLKPCEKPEDVQSAIRDVVAHLIENNTVSVMIGQNTSNLYNIYCAFELLKSKVSIAVSSPMFQFATDYKKSNTKAFINRIINNPDNFLYNYTSIGYQQYFVSEDDVEALKNMYFDAIRLGTVRKDLIEVEPEIRDSEIFGIDMSSVKQSDSPGNSFLFPNGFYAEEICQLAKYSGLSEKSRSFNIFNYNSETDHNEQTAQLIAQIIWYYLFGYYHRTSEIKDEVLAGDILKFIVHIEKGNQNLVFYKSKIAEKWWIEVPFSKSTHKKLIACSLGDYRAACENEVPDRWWKAFQKMN